MDGWMDGWMDARARVRACVCVCARAHVQRDVWLYMVGPVLSYCTEGEVDVGKLHRVEVWAPSDTSLRCLRCLSGSSSPQYPGIFYVLYRT